jgi:hypothetical protein
MGLTISKEKLKQVLIEGKKGAVSGTIMGSVAVGGVYLMKAMLERSKDSKLTLEDVLQY